MSWQKDTFQTAYWPVIRANGDHQIDVAQVLHRFLNFPATVTTPMWVVPAPGHAPHLGRVICSRVLSTDDQVLNIRPSFWASLFRAPNANLLKWNIFLVTIKWIEWYTVPFIRINLCPYASKYWRFKSFILHFISPFTITHLLFFFTHIYFI